MRIYYSLLTILCLSFFFSLPLLFPIPSSTSSSSSSFEKSYFSSFSFPLQISLILTSFPLFYDLLRNLFQHTLRAFHVSTVLFLLSSLCDLLLLSTHTQQIFQFIFNYREISFLIGLFSLIYHHRNIVNLHFTSMISAALWAFGFTSGLITYSHCQIEVHTNQKETLLTIPFISISISLILTIYYYFKFLCDQRLNPEKYLHKPKPLPSIQNNTSTQTLHTDYSLLIFIFTILLGLSHLYLFSTMFLPSISFQSSLTNLKKEHLAILIKACVTLIILSYANIYPYLMAYRDMEVRLIILDYYSLSLFFNYYHHY